MTDGDSMVIEVPRSVPAPIQDLDDRLYRISMERLSHEPALTPASTGISIMINNISILIDNFVQFLAIMRGSTGVIQGLIVSVRQLGTALLQPVWGYLADTYGRRKFIAMGFLIIAMVGFLLPIAPSPELILLLVGVQAIFGTMLLPAWNAWIGDRTDKHNRARIYGKISMIGVWSSMVVNIAISFYMNNQDPELSDVGVIRIPMYIGASLAIVSSFLVLFLSAERPLLRATRKDLEAPWKKMKRTLKDLNPKFVRFLGIEGTFYFAWAAAWPLFPYVMFDVATGWVDLATLALFMAFPSGLSYFYGGKVADKVGYKKMLLMTRPMLVIPPITAALAAIYQSIYFLYIGQFVVGATLGAATVSVNSLILNYAHETKRASYLSFHTMTIGIIGFLSSTLVGLILEFVAGNHRPSNDLLVILLVAVAGLRLVGNFGYYFVHSAK